MSVQRSTIASAAGLGHRIINMTRLRRAKKLGRRYQNPVPTTVGGAKLAFKVVPQMLANREERVPLRPLGPFRTDASVYETPPASGLRITWMGHSSSLVEIDGARVLVDPVWDERASPFAWMGPKRFFAPTIPLEELPRLDVVLVSHDHYDHLGEETVRRLAAVQPDVRWVTSLGVGETLRKFGVLADRISELDWTETAVIGGASGGQCEITSLPSRHFSGRSAFNRFETLWGSFVLRGAAGHSVYYGADSGWWDGYEEIGAGHGPFDLTMLEIGAYNDLWRQIHLGPDGAARAFREMGGAGLLMPIHWGLFNLALHAWQQPIERMLELADADGLKLWAPEPGVPTEVVRGAELRTEWWRRRSQA
jgi:L-ascorbate metabolism protein UlaG (beta-lactamase superfamily)